MEEFKFENLNIWRKIYLVLRWIGAAIVVGGVAANVFGFVEQKEDMPTIGFVAVGLGFVLFTFWLHIAVSRRKTGQLIVISILELFPLFNLLSALITIWIYSVSKREITEIKSQSEQT